MTSWTTRGDGIAQLSQNEIPTPEPGANELLIAMTAQALNYRDLLVINGEGHWRPAEAVVPLSDGVGTVVGVGCDVTRFVVGERASAMFLPRWLAGPLTSDTYLDPVGGPTNRGMLADYIVVDQDHAARTPRSLSDAEAASLPVAAVTAWHAVARSSVVGEGDTVLVHGTGGVSLFALQFAAARGARVAITSSSDDKLARAAALGAELTVNYRTGDVAAELLDWTDGAGVDHVIETVGGENLNLSLQSVRIGGTISFIGLIAGRSAMINTYDFVSKSVTIHGVETGSRDMYEQMSSFIDEHQIRPVIDATYPAAQIREALARLDAGAHFGKIVIAATP